jgi:subtilisin family serine protease
MSPRTGQRQRWRDTGLLLALMLAVLPTTPIAAGPGTAPRPTQVADEVLIRYSSPAAEHALAPTVAALGTAAALPGRGQVRRLRLVPSLSVRQVVGYLSGLAGVDLVQPNHLYYPTVLPDDTDIGQLWAAENSGQLVNGANYPFNNPGTPGADLGLAQAWVAQTDCLGVIVAVIDTGVDYGHGDLVGAMWDGAPTYPNHGWDFADGDNDPLPDKGVAEDAHGSHVAGIIGATGNNASGISGVCWRAEIMVLRAGSFIGGLSTSDVIASIEFAVDHGASVLNMSFGGEFTIDADPLFSDAIDYARAAGVLAVAAAGNGGADELGDDMDGGGDDGDPATRFFPCAFPQDNMVCVTASDQAHQPTTFGNFGASSVDLAAPGSNILSTGYAPNFTVMTGTSMATPQAAGTAALLWAQNPAYAYRDVRAALLASGTAVPAWSSLTVTGRVVHGDGAVRHLRPPTGLSFTLD